MTVKIKPPLNSEGLTVEDIYILISGLELYNFIPSEADYFTDTCKELKSATKKILAKSKKAYPALVLPTVTLIRQSLI